MWLYPPRPESAIPPSLIKSFEDRGFVGQIKFNGTLQVIDINAALGATFMTRHGELNRAWTPPPEIEKYFSGFPDSVFVGELLHNKHASVKNTIILFDVLRYLGKSLVGKTLAERLMILRSVTPFIKNIQVVETHAQDLTGLYHSLLKPTEEGVVLKDPNAKLRSCLRDGLNANWQVKCRRATKNYGF